MSLNPEGQIDPANPEFHDRPMWCVYGAISYPQFGCLRIKTTKRGLMMEVYSVRLGKPGFYEMSFTLDQFLAQWKMHFFFADHDDFMEFVFFLTTPKGVRR